MKNSQISESSTKTLEPSECSDGPDGKRRGPYQAQYVLYLLNLATMDRYTFPTGTVGGQIAVREVVDKTKWMRKLRGANVYPVVTLSDTFMPTRFGGRQRPHFEIKRWVSFGPDERALSARLGQTQAIESAAQNAEQPRIVAKPTFSEEMNDEIPSFDVKEDDFAADQHEQRRVTKGGVTKIAHK